MSISTHVLDASRGEPAAGMAVILHRLDGSVWTVLGQGATDDDGRCPQLTDGLELSAGEYRLRFDTGGYFAGRQTPTFYPVVELTFSVSDPTAHYHVPLLLSPFAFSTYRGS